MSKKLFKNTVAIVMATTLAFGGSITAFAADDDPVNGATGTGTSFDHVKTDITSVTLPTEGSVANIFNFYVDPERLIKGSGKLTTGEEVKNANDDGVYFKHVADDASEASGTVGIAAKAGAKVEVPSNAETGSYTYKEATDKYYKKGDPAATQEALTPGWYANDTNFGTADEALDDAPAAFPATGFKFKDSEGAEFTPVFATGDTLEVTGAKAATVTYSNESTAVPFVGKNSVDVDVKVTAKVSADNATKNIALVSTEEELAAATGPALLMNIVISDGTTTDQKAVKTGTDGVDVSAKIAGIAKNFEYVVDNGKYDYKAKEDATGWGSASLKLVGKTNKVAVPEGANAMTAPKIELTWSTPKHVDTPASEAPSIATKTYSYTAGTAVDVTVSLGTGDEGATSVKAVYYYDGDNNKQVLPTEHWSYASGKVTFKGAYTTAIGNKSMTRKHAIVFDDKDSTEVDITLQPAQ